MAYDVFISYSAKDKPTADAACAALEAAHVRCWIAPRDVVPGRNLGGAIVEAIGSSRVLVLIFSSHANSSQKVLREVERAFDKGVIIVPFRIEDVAPSADMEYYISTQHWLDAITPPLATHLQRLCQTVGTLVPRERVEEPAKPRVAPRAKPQPAPSAARQPASPVAPQPAATIPSQAETGPRPEKWFRHPLIIGSAATGALLAGLLLAILFFWGKAKPPAVDDSAQTVNRPSDLPPSTANRPPIDSRSIQQVERHSDGNQNKPAIPSPIQGPAQNSVPPPKTPPDTERIAGIERQNLQRTLPRDVPARDGAGRKLAVLVGVRTYQHSDLKNLDYSENDVEELATLLSGQGFGITLLTTRAKPTDLDQFPTAENIRRQLATVLKGVTKHDLVLVGLAGHGLQPLSSSQSYFCPYDANPSERDGKLVNPETLLSLGEILGQLRESGVGQKLLLVDACRNDPQVRGGRRGGGVTQVDVSSLPHQTGVLLSCAQGEFSFESKAFGSGHGAFFYEVIEGLKGAAKDEDGEVTWESLRSFVRKHVPSKVQQVFGNDGGQQNPNEIGNLTGTPTVLARIESRVPNSEPPQFPPKSDRPTDEGGTAKPPAGAPPGDSHDTLPRKPLPSPDGRPPLLVAPFNPSLAVERRAAWAHFQHLPEQMQNSLEMSLTLIPPGQFWMGIEQGAHELAHALPHETPRHAVRITKPFYLGTYEVTIGQFRKFVDETHHKTDAESNRKGGFGYSEREKKPMQRPNYNWKSWGIPQPDNSPVVNVSWNDASRFCEWLSQKEKKNYRLPTEAEWEYACRAGTTSLYYNGNNPEELTRIGNVGDAAGRAKFPPTKFPKWAAAIGTSDNWVFPAPVGTFAPNSFGLYDMIGNACEWCEDWFDPSYYAASPPADPTGPASGMSRVIRGGGWTGTPLNCRSAQRWYGPPNDYLWDTGFRIVCTP